MAWHHQSITTPAAFPAADSPHVDLQFEPRQIVIRNDGAAKVDVSFDGTNVHATIAAGGKEVFNTRAERKFWFRDGAGSGDLDFRANNNNVAS